MMEASGNNVAVIMSYSGHKSLESFQDLYGPAQGCKAVYVLISTSKALAYSWPLFTIMGTQGTADKKSKHLEKQRIAVS
jgi:hypothetical protein